MSEKRYPKIEFQPPVDGVVTITRDGKYFLKVDEDMVPKLEGMVILRGKGGFSMNRQVVRPEGYVGVEHVAAVHRAVMGVESHKRYVVHLNGDKSDNRRANLEVCGLRGMKKLVGEIKANA